jgi:hypothetical protein
MYIDSSRNQLQLTYQWLLQLLAAATAVDGALVQSVVHDYVQCVCASCTV